MKRIGLFLLSALVIGILPAQQTLTNDSILKLVKAGMGEDLILSMINTQPSNFALGPDDVVTLKSGGVSEKVIAAMIVKKDAPPPGLTTSAQIGGPVHEVGVYYKKGDMWVDVEPEVVNFKTGGVLKSIATDGIVKGDVNGNIKGPHSKTEVKTPVEILVYTPEGTAITEYQLLRLHEQSNAREFRTVTGGVFHKSGGASRDTVDFEGQKIAPRTYSITLTAVKGGEYGLLPPASGDATGSTGRLGKLYTFHVIE